MDKQTPPVNGEEVVRYEAVHLRYDDNNIRYGEGCEVEVVTAADFNRITEALLEDARYNYQLALDWQDKVIALQTERDQLRAEVERLRDDYEHAFNSGEIARAECDALRALLAQQQVPENGHE